MSMYLFILGKDPELSLAELFSVYPKAEIKSLRREFVLMKMQEEFTRGDLHRLGGTIKVARLLTTVRPGALNETLVRELSARHDDKKINYGVSVYDWAEANLRRVLSRLKKSLRQAEVKSRFANTGYQNLSTAQHKGLGGGGVEFVVARDAKGLLVGEVVAVQDIDFYSKRDYDKPYRNMKVGMLPPKLAQILVNLTGIRKGSIWDPFCGGGGLLLEGLLMGHDMLGSDIDSKVLEGARKNVGWLQREFNVRSKADLFIHDATKPLKGKVFDAIACEGYLGPPLERKLRADQLQPLIARLEKLYVDFFKALSEVKFRGPVVIAMPFFRAHEDREVALDSAVKKIKQLGFHLTPLLPEALTGHETFYLKYARPDQLVGRAIYRFTLL